MAASSGRLEVLKYLRQEGCPWDAMTIVSAHGCDQLEVADWAKEQGCPEPTVECEGYPHTIYL